LKHAALWAELRNKHHEMPRRKMAQQGTEPSLTLFKTRRQKQRNKLFLVSAAGSLKKISMLKATEPDWLYNIQTRLKVAALQAENITVVTESYMILLFKITQPCNCRRKEPWTQADLPATVNGARPTAKEAKRHA
jgi:hypothetical protein